MHDFHWSGSNDTIQEDRDIWHCPSRFHAIQNINGHKQNTFLESWRESTQKPFTIIGKKKILLLLPSFVCTGLMQAFQATIQKWVLIYPSYLIHNEVFTILQNNLWNNFNWMQHWFIYRRGDKWMKHQFLKDNSYGIVGKG